MSSRRMLLVTPLLLALAATACGSSKNTPTAAGTNPTTTVAPATTTTAAGPPTVSTGNSTIGTVLVNSAGRTLYHFDKDTAGAFGCNAGCTSVWPPLTVTGTPVAGAGVTGTLGVRMRDDGSHQVTWNGLPLYTFVQDQAAGDTKGDGFAGGLWHAAKLSAAGAGAGTATTAANGGYNY